MPELITQVVVDEAEDARRRARFPLGAQLTLVDMETAGSEHRLDEVRASEPITWMPDLGGWLVTSRDIGRSVLMPKSGMTVLVEQNMVRASTGFHMLTVDEPEHGRQRAPFEQSFRAREATALFADEITRIADQLISDLSAEGTCSLGPAFASPFAVQMAAYVIGLPLDEVHLIDGIYSDFANAMVYDGDPGPLERAEAARTRLNALLLPQLQQAREAGATSLAAHVLRDPANDLSDAEVVDQLRVVMFGAIETIQASVMNTMMFLLQHPEQFAEVRADRSLIPGAVEESIRLMPPVAFVERWTGRPVELGGVQIGVGEFIGVSTLATNRDPAVFENPTAYDIHRENAKHGLSFSFGEHHCLGVHLARMQTAIAIEQLIDRLPGLRLVSCEAPSGFAFRRPASMTLAWTA